MKTNTWRKLRSLFLAICVVTLYAAPVWAYDNNEEEKGGKAGRDATYSYHLDENDNNTAIGKNALAGNGGTVTKVWVEDSRKWVPDYRWERGKKIECGGHYEVHGHFEYPVTGGNNDNNKAIGDSAKAGNGDGNQGNEAYGTNAQAGNGYLAGMDGVSAEERHGQQPPKYTGGNNIDNVANGKDAKAGNGNDNIDNMAIGKGAQAGNGDGNVGNTALGSGAVAGNGSGVVHATAVGNGAQATSSHSTAVGTNSHAGYNSTAVGDNSNASAPNSVALGADTYANAPGSVALGQGSQTGDRENTVSVGNSNQQRQITNVAPGTEGTDAVNVNQLKGVESSLNTKIDDTNLRLDRVGALAAAMSGLVPIAYDPERPTQISLGGGSYSGQQAVALGIFHYTKDDVLLNAGYAISSGEQMARVGVTWKLGSKKKAPIVEESPVVAPPVVVTEAPPTTTTTVVETPENTEVQQPASSTESRKG